MSTDHHLLAQLATLFVGLLLALVATLFGSWLMKVVWNRTFPDIFNWKRITYLAGIPNLDYRLARFR